MPIQISALSKYQEICLTCPIPNGCVYDVGFVGDTKVCPKWQAENNTAMQITVPGHALSCPCNECNLANRVMACWDKWDRTPLAIDDFCIKFNFYRGTVGKWIVNGKVKAERRFGINTKRKRLLWYILDIEKPPPNLNPQSRLPQSPPQIPKHKIIYEKLRKSWDDGKTLTAMEYATETGLTAQTVYRWLKNGKLIGYEKTGVGNGISRYYVTGFPES